MTPQVELSRLGNSVRLENTAGPQHTLTGSSWGLKTGVKFTAGLGQGHAKWPRLVCGWQPGGAGRCWGKTGPSPEAAQGTGTTRGQHCPGLAPTQELLWDQSGVAIKSIRCESKSEAAQSCLTLCNAVDCSPPGSSIHGILQERKLEWVAISFSRGSSRPRD